MNGLVGTDTISIDGDAVGVTSLNAVAGANVNLDNVEVVNFTSNSGVLNLGAAGVDVGITNLNVTGGGLTATQTAASQAFTLTGSGAAILTFGALAAGGTFTTDSGIDTINNVTLATETASTGAGNDTVNIAANAGMGAALNGGAGTGDILNIAASAAGALSMATISNFETVNLIPDAGGNALTISDGVTIVTGTGVGVVTVNATAPQAGGLAVTLANAADIFNVTTAGTFTLGVLTGVEDVNFAAGNNTVTTVIANVSGATTGFDGGLGTNILTLTDVAAAATDLDTVTGFDTINLGGAANKITFTPDTIVATGETLSINAMGATGLTTLNVATETDGIVNFTAGAGGSVFTMAANTLADTVTMGAGADAVILDASSTVGNIANLDIVSGFKLAGADTINMGAVPASGTMYSLSIATASAATLVGAMNTAIATAGIATAIGDVYVVEVLGGAAAGLYAVEDVTADNITADDYIVGLAGGTGVLGAADFI